MSYRNSSAGTAAKKSFKSSLILRPAIILAMLLLCAVSSTEAQTIMPMPIYGGGHMEPMQGVALWVVLNVAIIIGLCIRFLLIKKDQRFSYQSPLKNFFYELNDDNPERQKELSGYDWYVYCKPSLNFLMMGIVIINCFGVVTSLSLLLYRWWS